MYRPGRVDATQYFRLVRGAGRAAEKQQVGGVVDPQIMIEAVVVAKVLCQKDATGFI
jgi:hypothetical protein